MQRRPCVGNVAVVVAMVRVINVRVNSTLEDAGVRSWFGWSSPGRFADLDIWIN